VCGQPPPPTSQQRCAISSLPFSRASLERTTAGATVPLGAVVGPPCIGKPPRVLFRGDLQAGGNLCSGRPWPLLPELLSGHMPGGHCSGESWGSSFFHPQVCTCPGGVSIRQFPLRRATTSSQPNSQPRNFRHLGAFDDPRAYLRECKIAALASKKSESVEVLPGSSGAGLNSGARESISRGATMSL
jgi:hypothetical protein